MKFSDKFLAVKIKTCLRLPIKEKYLPGKNL